MDLKQYNELLELLEKSEEDVRNGRVAPTEETFKELREMLGSDQQLRLLFYWLEG